MPMLDEGADRQREYLFGSWRKPPKACVPCYSKYRVPAVQQLKRDKHPGFGRSGLPDIENEFGFRVGRFWGGFSACRDASFSFLGCGNLRASRFRPSGKGKNLKRQNQYIHIRK